MPSGIEHGIDHGIDHNVDKILSVISFAPKATQKQIADALGMSVRTVAPELKHLQEEGVIKRVGSDRSGHWEMIKGD
jgi:ATP-dependent DNA helicase RecG